MKKIGFIDSYLSEWHANNYPAWIKESCQKSGTDYRITYAYAERDVSPVDGKTTDDWCAAFGAEKVTSIGELVEKSDCIMILAPSDPQTHERLSECALKSGKPVYVDKTFAPDAGAATRMIALAEKNGTPMFSSSALRYATEIAAYQVGKTADTLFVTGGGKFDEYCIHVFEMVVTVMKENALRLRCDMQGCNKAFTVDFGGGRRAVTLHTDYDAPFTVGIGAQADSVYASIASDYFRRFIDSVLAFFASRTPPVPAKQTMTVAKIIDAAKLALRKPDEWISL